MTDLAAGDLPPPAPQHRPIPLRHVGAVVIGNALEFYDFLTYGFFAVYIGKTFFPSDSPGASLLLALATFGAGFLTRPIGAVVIGSMGDRVGRKPAMLLSFGLMGAAIIGLAATPSYAQIGLAAPILVIALRMLQGFALGGEVGPTTAFLVEAAAPHRRGLYTVFQSVSQSMALLASGIVGTTLASTLDAQQLQDWGWRVAMLIGACIVPFGLMVRRSLPELDATTPDDHPAAAAHEAASPGFARLRPFRKAIVLGLMMLTAGTIGTYILNFLTTYALTSLAMPATISFGVLILNGVLAGTFQFAAGILSDRFGRRPVMLFAGAALLVSITPAFWCIVHFRTPLALYAAVAWLVPLAALTAAPAIVMLTESVPRSIRSGIVATVYAVAISIFGGSTQFVVAWLLQVTGDPLALAYYWTAAAVLGFTAILLSTESAPIARR